MCRQCTTRGRHGWRWQRGGTRTAHARQGVGHGGSHASGNADVASQIDEPGVDGAAIELPDTCAIGDGDIRANRRDPTIAHHQRAALNDFAGCNNDARTSQDVPTRRLIAQSFEPIGADLRVNGELGR